MLLTEYLFSHSTKLEQGLCDALTIYCTPIQKKKYATFISRLLLNSRNLLLVMIMRSALLLE